MHVLLPLVADPADHHGQVGGLHAALDREALNVPE